MLTADMRTGQLEMLAQEVRQVETRQDMRIDALWDRTTDQDWDEAERTAADAGAFWKTSEPTPVMH